MIFRPKYITFDCYGTLTCFRMGEMARAMYADRIPAERIDAFIADFSAYRQRLAGAVPTTRPAEPARQAKGKVQAEVQDRKQAAATTPDQLKRSQGAGRASAPEAQIS